MSIGLLYILQAIFFTVIVSLMLENQRITREHYDKTERLVDDLILTLKLNNKQSGQNDFTQTIVPETTYLSKEK
tara:strand:+ start:281 stop:502 length:222 start_codon:yes stop_codon:yes gene_type:complete